MDQNIILNNLEIEHKIKRIAYQIYETFVDEQSIIAVSYTHLDVYKRQPNAEGKNITPAPKSL